MHEGIEPFINRSLIIAVLKGLTSHILDFLARETEAHEIEEEEIMEVIRAHFVLGLLGDISMLIGRQKFR